MKKGAKLFGNHLERYLNRDILVETECSHVLTKLLDGLLEHDDFAVNFVTCLFESFGDLYVVDRTEDSAG